MRYGFIKTAATSVSISLGNPTENASRVLAAISNASARGARVLVLPRLCLIGATMGDLTVYDAVSESAKNALESVLRGSASMDVLTVLTQPIRIGAATEECAVAFYHGEILGLIPTACDGSVTTVRAMGRDLPYGEIVFVPNCLPTCKIGVSFDLSEAAEGATVTLVPMAMPETVGAREYRLETARMTSRVCTVAFADCGHGESTTDYVYGGHCAVVEDGEVLSEAPPLSGEMSISEADTAYMFGRGGLAAREVEFCLNTAETELTREYPRFPFVPSDNFAARAEMILSLQAEGLATRIEHVKSRCVVIGVSGGLDSTLALIVAVRAMQRLNRPFTDVVGITLPCFGTSARTLSQAQRLMKAFGVTQKKINVKRAVLAHFADIKQDPETTDATYENAQARERTQVLMDTANQLGGLHVGTGDLSEAALGWATYNGDHMSMYDVNNDIPKTLVRALVEHVARTTDTKSLSKVLLDVAATPVSPELLPTANGKIVQITEDKIGPYELHDFFLYCTLGKGFAPDKTYHLAVRTFKGVYDSFTVSQHLRTFVTRFFSQQFKRNCAPDGVTVGSVGLSPRTFRMPSDASAKAWLDSLDQR